MKSEALLPLLLTRSKRKWIIEILGFTLGIAGLALLAQVTIYLPGSPVPITGQTFGVALIALTWGARRAPLVVLGYLAVGAAGLPVFAMGKSGLMLGPTLGYLVGMLVASVAMGLLADRGFTKSFGKSVLATYIGSLLTFTFGLIGLSYFVPREALLTAGLWPFLPGDTIKNITAAWIASRLRRVSA